MKRALWLCVLLSLPLSASAEPFGEPFPVTNTRYRTAFGEPRLVTNDRDFFMFWGADQQIRAARVDDGEPRVSHAVLDINSSYDVAWTGEHFLIVGGRTNEVTNVTALFGRILDAEAHPIGAELAIGVPNGDRPRLAVGAHSIALVYRTLGQTRVMLFSKDGRVLSPSRVIAQGVSTHAVTRSGDGFLVVAAINGVIRAMTLDQNGQTIAEGTFAAGSNAFRNVAVASDGTNALAVWSGDAKMRAVTIDGNATFGAPLELFGTSRSSTPAVTWNGGGWTVAYGQDGAWITEQVVIVQIHWRGHTILSREDVAVGTVNPTVAALDGRMLAAWRTNGQRTSPVVQRLPLADHQPRKAPYVPAPQTLLASASSSDAMLTVWSEQIESGVSIHAGLRNLQGQWTERLLTTLPMGRFPNAPNSAVAASDGNGFVVVVWGWGATSSSLIRLDSAGRQLGAPVQVPIVPAAIAWNGTNYGLISENGSGVLVSPAGTVSALTGLHASFSVVTLASDGSGFFVAGNVYDCGGITTCLAETIEVRGARLGPDLQRVDPDDYVIPGDHNPEVIGAAWDGSTYFLIGTGLSIGNFIADIPLSPRSAIDVREFFGVSNMETIALLRDGTIAVAGREFGSPKSAVAISKRDGSSLHLSEIEGSPTAAPRLEPLADGGVAFLVSSMQSAAPHDGTSRVVTAIARGSNVEPPSAPHVGVRVQNGYIHVDWTTPPGTVNGFRLEYRIDDDEWVELEQWFPPGSQRKSIRVPSFGTQFAFRVRAFNDGGAGEYSQTAFTKPSRRRAVR